MGGVIVPTHNLRFHCESQEVVRKKVAAFARVPTCIVNADKELSEIKEVMFLKVHLNLSDTLIYSTLKRKEVAREAV